MVSLWKPIHKTTCLFQTKMLQFLKTEAVFWKKRKFLLFITHKTKKKLFKVLFDFIIKGEINSLQSADFLLNLQVFFSFFCLNFQVCDFARLASLGYADALF